MLAKLWIERLPSLIIKETTVVWYKKPCEKLQTTWQISSVLGRELAALNRNTILCSLLYADNLRPKHTQIFEELFYSVWNNFMGILWWNKNRMFSNWDTRTDGAFILACLFHGEILACKSEQKCHHQSDKAVSEKLTP